MSSPFRIPGPGTASGYSMPGGGGGGGGADPVQPPGPTSQSVASGVNLSPVTFGAFTDPSSVIASFQAVTTNSTGSASWAGSGLGAYTPTSSAGDSGTLSLNAKDAAGKIVATAIHTYERAAAGGGGGENWTQVYTKDLTSLSSTTLVAGSQTVDGVTINCQADGETVGGGNGLTASATKYSYVTGLGGNFTLASNPKLLIAKISVASWGGTGTGQAIRARLFSAIDGAAPSGQTRLYPASGDIRVQLQFQPRYPSGTGSFTSAPFVVAGAGQGAVTTWYHHVACVYGNWIVYAKTSPTVPASLSSLLDIAGDATKIAGGVNAFTASTTEGDATYWPNTVVAGLFTQSNNSKGRLEEIQLWEFK